MKTFQALLYYVPPVIHPSLFSCTFQWNPIPRRQSQKRIGIICQNNISFPLPCSPHFWIGMFAKYFRQPEETIRKMYACCWPKTNSFKTVPPPLSLPPLPCFQENISADCRGQLEESWVSLGKVNWDLSKQLLRPSCRRSVSCDF